jgi:Phosphate-starvation-inducible E family
MVVHVEPERTEQERRHVGLFRETAEAWPGLGLYARFEQAVALALTFLVSWVIVVAIANLVLAAGLSLFFNRLAPLDHTVFQNIFGMIMTVLIALEFNHTIFEHPSPQGKYRSAADGNPHCITRHGTEIHHH